MQSGEVQPQNQKGIYISYCLATNQCMEIVRTTTHSYPKDEEDAMRAFYNGKRCVITFSDVAEWAHMLDATMESSNPQVSKYSPGPSCI